MKPPGKRLRAITKAPPPQEDMPAKTLPGDLVLEIALRADAATLVRFAACSKPLRRDILSPDFIRRFCLMPTACLLGFLHAYDHMLPAPAPRPSALFSLLHPSTPAAASFFETRIVPRLAHGFVADLLLSYEPVTSRHGLLVLRRRHIELSDGRDICVLDPFTGNRAFFPHPPDIKYDSGFMYTLLTAADGVGSSFLLAAADFINPGGSCSIKIQTVSSTNSDREWGPAMVTHPLPLQQKSFLCPCCGAVVVGTLIYWLMYSIMGSLILTYRVGATTSGLIELPAGGLPDVCSSANLHLTLSPDGRLRLLVAHRFTVSIWLLLSTGNGWERQASINISPLAPDLTQQWPEPERTIEFFGLTGGRSGAVLLQLVTTNCWARSGENRVLLLDMETKEMRRFNSGTDYIRTSFPYEVDLSSRLSAMKIF